MLKSHDQGRVECCAQPFGLFVEQGRPARIVVDDLNLIHLLGSMTQPLGTRHQTSAAPEPGNVRKISHEIQRVTSLNRAISGHGNWPEARDVAWSYLDSSLTKG